MNAGIMFASLFRHRGDLQTDNDRSAKSAGQRLSSVGWTLLVLMCVLFAGSTTLRSQDAGGDPPTAPGGDYGGKITTAGCYDAYTYNARRTVTDLVVPGSNGQYPLAFTRISNSRVGAGTTTEYFGDGGNWRHSYQWDIYPLSYVNNNYQNGASAINVVYPDGALVTFRPPANRYPNTPTYEDSTYWRGPAGTEDRLELPADTAAVILHTTDGGVVIFGNANHGLAGASATSIIDPYGAKTVLTYNGNALTDVTEPGGRSLHLHYSTSTYTYGTWPNVHSYSNTYLDYVQASTGERVEYLYYIATSEGSQPNPAGQPYLCLNDVEYIDEANTQSNGRVAALYWYMQGGNYAPPVLSKALDPHYAGPMTNISYGYQDAIKGLIGQEKYYDYWHGGTVGPSVSAIRGYVDGLNVTHCTETRGDVKASDGTPITRVFNYGEGTNNASTPDVGNSTFAAPAQVTSSTNFEGRTTSYCYYGSGNKDGSGTGTLRAVLDSLGNKTTYAHEPITGKVTAVGLSDGRARYWTYLSKDLSDPSNHYTLQPYYLYSSVDERGQTTKYLRYPDTGLIKEIDYPDGSNEQFQYTAFPTQNGKANPDPNAWGVNQTNSSKKNTYTNGYYYKLGYYRNRLGAQFYFNYGTDSHAANGHADLLKSVTRYYNDGHGSMPSENTYFTYDGMDRLYQLTEPANDSGNVVTQFSYNSRHQLTQILHVADSTHVDYTYDDYGNCTSVSDELWPGSGLTHVSQTAYDVYRRPTQVTTPVNYGSDATRTCCFVYDVRNANHQSVASSASHTRSQWSVGWAKSGKGVERIYSPGSLRVDEYDGVMVGGSSPVTVTAGADSVHHVSSTVYHAAASGSPGNVTQTFIDAQNQATVAVYDVFGRKQSLTDPLNHVATWTYYANGQAAAIGSGGNPNCGGWLKSVTSPGPDLNNYPSVTSTYADYDAMGRVKATQDPYNRPFISGYDANGNLTSQSDGDQTNATAPAPNSMPPAHNIGYSYDQLGRKVSATNPVSGSSETWTYYPSGALRTYKNYANAQCTFTYDQRGRCTGCSWSDGVTSPTSYQYDVAGRVTAVMNWHANIGYTYDDSGAVRTETLKPGDLSTPLTTTYSYDADGNVASVQYPSGAYPSYHYDAQQRCTGMYGGSTNWSVYTYTGDWLTQRALLNGAYTTYGHQNNGRVTDVWHQRIDSSGNWHNISRHAYGYNPDGRISWFDREADGGSSGSILENQRGDAFYYAADGSLTNVGRNISATGGWPARFDASHDSEVSFSNVSYAGGTTDSYGSYFNYDAAGNRNSANQYSPTQSISYSTKGDNEYLNSTSNGTSSSWTYGSNFNTQNAGTGWSYAYDAENHLISATGPSGQGASFFYDGLGRLTKQNVNGTVTRFYYAGSQRIEERDANNNWVYRYLFDGPNTDQILYREDSSYNRFWYQTDLMGNTTHLTNGVGQVVEQYLYDAYGKPSVYDAAGNPRAGSTVDNRYLFKSNGAYEWLPTMGLYYCRARFYLPQHGRWLQTDPIGQAGGLNIYAYCHNDPVNSVDPSGLDDDGDFLGSFFYYINTGIYGFTPADAGGFTGGLVSTGSFPSVGIGGGTNSGWALGSSPHSSTGINSTIGGALSSMAGGGLDAVSALLAPIANMWNHPGDALLDAANPLQRPTQALIAMGSHPSATYAAVSCRAVAIAQSAKQDPWRAVGYTEVMALGLFSPVGEEAEAGALVEATESLEAAEGAGMAGEGIYEFPAASGKTYVGQSGNIAQRFVQHTASGKLLPGTAVRTTEVLGGRTAREIAEQLRINELGGIEKLDNIRNPIGPARQYLLPTHP